MILCVIVDDEPLAVALLGDHVRRVADLDLILATTDALCAIECVQHSNIDLLFVDIQMPGLNGIEVMKIIDRKCLVIITSAFSQYAIDGYDHHVVDYLLKPVTLSRFLTAITKARDRLKNTIVSTEGFTYFKVDQRMQRVNFNDILFIEGLKDYVAVHLLSGKLVVLQTMKGMEEILPGDQFIRSHKSYIVSARKIEQIHKQYVVINKVDIPIGDYYKDSFLKKVLNP